MEIQFLGTGAGLPAKHRNVSSIALKLLAEINQVWLFDVGEGTQMQILHTTIRPRKVEKIFITHLHGDHIFGLPGFLSSRSFQASEEGANDLEIYGPVGIKEFVQTSIRLSGSKLSYKIIFHELPHEGGVIFEDKNFKVTALPTDHGIESFAYRVEEADHPGELQVEKLRELNIPSGPVYGKLKRGEVVTLEDGRTLDGRDYIGVPKKGRVVVISGDTRKNKNVEKLAQDADVLVHESTFASGEERIAYRYFHSTAKQAAEVAKAANAKKLYLTHISARYLKFDAIGLQKQAQKVFKNSQVVFDFDEFDIPMAEGHDEK